MLCSFRQPLIKYQLKVAPFLLRLWCRATGYLNIVRPKALPINCTAPIAKGRMIWKKGSAIIPTTIVVAIIVPHLIANYLVPAGRWLLLKWESHADGKLGIDFLVSAKCDVVHRDVASEEGFIFSRDLPVLNGFQPFLCFRSQAEKSKCQTSNCDKC